MTVRKPLVLVNGRLEELAATDWIAMYRTWVSGMTVNQWEEVISPADGETYRRITTTGSGTTDPADDLTNYIATSYERVTALPVTTSLFNGSGAPTDFANGSVKVAPGVIAAGVRTQLLSITGRGDIAYLGFQKSVVNGGRFELLVDGRELFDASIQSAIGDVDVLIGAPGVGVTSGPAYRPAYFAVPEKGVPFRRSVAVWYTPTANATTVNTTLAHIIRATQ